MSGKYHNQNVLQELRVLARSKPEGTALPTVRQLIDQFEVSQSTLERCLRELEREGVLYRQARKGIFAGSGYRTITGRYGLVMPHSSRRMETLLARAVEKALAGEDRQLTTCSTHLNSAKELELLTELEKQGADGIILYPVPDAATHEPVGRRLERYRTSVSLPLVILDHLPGAGPACGSVRFDYYAALREATELVIDKGYRDFAYVGHFDAESDLESFNGFRAGLDISHMEQDTLRIVHLRRGNESKREQVKDLLACPPQALFVGYAPYLHFVQEEILLRGLRVPDDLLVVSVVEENWRDYARIPLLALSRPGGEMAAEAVRLVRGAADSGNAPDEHLLLKLKREFSAELRDSFHPETIGVLPHFLNEGQ
jgi:LacI family transcriptional regulator